MTNMPERPRQGQKPGQGQRKPRPPQAPAAAPKPQPEPTVAPEAAPVVPPPETPVEQAALPVVEETTPPAQGTAWEYVYVRLDFGVLVLEADMQKALNALGAEGYEVAVLTSDRVIIIGKRLAGTGVTGDVEAHAEAFRKALA
jgi:hypothetical protein